MSKFTTNIETMRAADWDGTEREVVAKIRLLRGLAEKLESNPTNDRIANDLILPALMLLGQFCQSVQDPERN